MLIACLYPLHCNAAAQASSVSCYGQIQYNSSMLAEVRLMTDVLNRLKMSAGQSQARNDITHYIITSFARCWQMRMTYWALHADQDGRSGADLYIAGDRQAGGSA